MSEGADSNGTVQRVVLATCVLGLVSFVTLLVLSATVWSDLNPEWPTSFRVVAFFVVLTTLGQMLYVKVRHGTTTEELNFFEVVLAAGILMLAPAAVLIATMTGMLIGEALIRRAWIKVAFNIGNYATSTSAMIATYWVLLNWLLTPDEVQARSETMLSAASVFSLIVASAVFTATNLILLAPLLHYSTGATLREVVSEEWWLSGLMALGSVGIGAIAVGLRDTPAALPFALLPALALWYAYTASAQHAEERERNRWLVALGGVLAQHGQDKETLSVAVSSIRQIVNAPKSLVIDPRQMAADSDSRWTHVLLPAQSGPTEIKPSMLPVGWRTGVAIRLDLGADEPGILLLGSTSPYRPSRIPSRARGWSLAEADAPVLGALVAAVGSALRAGAAFDALTEETAKLTAVVDNTSDGIAMVDDSGHVRLWSQTMARMTGIAAVSPDADPSQAPEIVRRLVEASGGGGGTAIQVHLVREDGEELDVSLSAVRVREAMATNHEDDTGWVSILTVHDETRERRVERMKSDFVATVSHELRTPITPIKGYARLLATKGDRVTPEKRATMLNVIADRADHLTRLVDDLLLASQVSEGSRLPVSIGVAELGGIVREAIETFPQMASRINFTPPAQPVMVQCDQFRAVQCLNNLIGNAEKYAPPESAIDITVEVIGLRARVQVRDHGDGIPAAEQDKVFERFYRREDPFTMRHGGAGLGLHIARELAIAMGGGLELMDPPEGTGALFVFTLLTTDAPAVAGRSADGAAPGAAPAPAGPGSPRRPPSPAAPPPLGPSPAAPPPLGPSPAAPPPLGPSPASDPPVSATSGPAPSRQTRTHDATSSDQPAEITR